MQIRVSKSTAPAALLIAVALSGNAVMAAAATGRQAPAFDLPIVDGSGFLSSAELFGAADATFLVFWDSGCRKCIESLRGCETFHRRIAGSGYNMAGIAGGGTGDLEIKNIVDSASLTFPQLRDRDHGTAAAYGVEPGTFAIFLIGGDGAIDAGAMGTGDDPAGVMESMLLGEGDYSRGAGAAEGSGLNGGVEAVRSAAAAARISVGGSVRIKFLSVDTRGDEATGPYGEVLRQGNDLLQRYELEISAGINRNLRVGGLLRISNEGLDVLRSGPEYYDSEWGSVFAEGDYGRFLFRLGYFTMYMTPLTMMRWDWDDNPRTGGDAGCGCGAAGGILIVESLEELGPDLTFEGGMVRMLSGDFEARIFYAMPRRARDTKAVEYQFGGEESAAYSMEIFGMTGVWRRPDRRTGSVWSAGVHLLAGREDPRSVEAEALGYSPFERYDSEILTLTASVPVTGRIGLRGEWIAYNRARGYDLGPENDDEIRLEGSGGIAGVLLEEPGLYDVKLDYLRLGDGFFSPFAALSYEAGRHGPRINCRFGMPGGWPALMIFYKRLYGLEEPMAGAEKDNVSTAGVTFDANFTGGPGFGIYYLDRHEWRDGELNDFDDRRRTYTAILRYRFGPVSWLEGMYQRIENDSTAEGGRSEAGTDIFSVYFRAEF